MKFKSLFIFLTLSTFAVGQEKLTFEQALALTLENNYDIQLAKISAEIAENSASRANNGYLPSINATGNYGWTYTEGENRLVGETRSFDPNNAYNYGASVTADYTLFNGQARRYGYLQSQENLTMSQLELKQILQNTVLALSQTFHEVARLEENVTSLRKAVEISLDRKKRAEYSYEYGQSNKLEVLNSKVDLNADSIALITGLQELENVKRNLNYIMGQSIDENLTVDRRIQIKQDILQEDVLMAITEGNIDILLNQSNIALNRYLVGAGKSNWMPTLDANAGYLYNGSDNPNSPFVIGSRSFGPQAGVTLRWSLFNAQNNIAIKNAKLTLKRSEIEKKALEQNVRSIALNAFATYKNQLFILRSQSDNVQTAQDNFNRSQESFQLGQISSVEFRQAQLNLINSEQALSSAKYDTKNSELQLLAIMGILVE